jgi:hypothetical protein
MGFYKTLAIVAEQIEPMITKYNRKFGNRPLPEKLRLKLITPPSGNPKLGKSSILNCGLFLSAAEIAEGESNCKWSTESCRANCIVYTGRAEFIPSINRARINRTLLYRNNFDQFLDRFCSDLVKIRHYQLASGTPVAFRFNGTTDLDWSHLRAIIPNYWNWNFYDYTKRPLALSRPILKWAHLTYSLDCSFAPNMRVARAWIRECRNIAVIFRKKPTLNFPSFLKFIVDGREIVRPVVDGDRTDLRFTDPAGCVVGLRAKGRLRRDRSLFALPNSRNLVVDLDNCKVTDGEEQLLDNSDLV